MINPLFYIHRERERKVKKTGGLCQQFLKKLKGLRKLKVLHVEQFCMWGICLYSLGTVWVSSSPAEKNMPIISDLIKHYRQFHFQWEASRGPFQGYFLCCCYIQQGRAKKSWVNSNIAFSSSNWYWLCLKYVWYFYRIYGLTKKKQVCLVRKLLNYN